MLMQKLISILKTFWLFLNLYCLLYLCKRISHQLRLTNYLGRFVLIPVSIKSYVSLMHDFRYFTFGASLLYFMLYLLTFFWFVYKKICVKNANRRHLYMLLLLLCLICFFRENITWKLLFFGFVYLFGYCRNESFYFRRYFWWCPCTCWFRLGYMFLCICWKCDRSLMLRSSLWNLLRIYLRMLKVKIRIHKCEQSKT